MKLTTLYLFALVAAPISAIPKRPKQRSGSAPCDAPEIPYHGSTGYRPKHHRPYPTGSVSPNRPESSVEIPPYPTPSSHGGGLPPGTGFPGGTGSPFSSFTSRGAFSPTSTSSPLPVITGTGGTSLSVPVGTGSGGKSSGTDTASTPKGTGVPAGCLKKNGIAVGWLPEAASDFATITSNLGKPGCYFGQYAQITSSTWDGSQLTQVSADDIGGAIFIASVMPEIPFSQVDTNVASQVAAVMKKFTDQGVEVYLRFGHEMNWYASAEGGVYHGTAAEFVAAWKVVAAAVADNDKVSMFWSPNNVGGDDSQLTQWWPGPETVDVVGIDIYPKSHQSFSDAYKGFHDTLAKPYHKPFVIGETGYSSSSDSDKTYWLEQLSSSEALSSCPNYAGFSWFEYNKEENFYVASHGDNVAKQVLG